MQTAQIFQKPTLKARHCVKIWTMVKYVVESRPVFSNLIHILWNIDKNPEHN